MDHLRAELQCACMKAVEAAEAAALLTRIERKLGQLAAGVARIAHGNRVAYPVAQAQKCPGR
jgi:hypothetical protein